MKLLEHAFTKYGHNYSLVERRNDIAIYAREKQGRVEYEVFRVLKHNGLEIAGVKARRLRVPAIGAATHADGEIPDLFGFVGAKRGLRRKRRIAGKR